MRGFLGEAMQIEITTDEQPLSHTVWTFYVKAGFSPTIDVKLEKCVEWKRPSTRHRKWSAERRWPAHRDVPFVMPKRPDVPPEVEVELRKRIADAVRFEWSTP